MAYTAPIITDSPLEGISLTTTYSPPYDASTGTGSIDYPSPPFTVGTIINTSNGGQYMFVLAAAAITQYDFVSIETSYNASPVSVTTVNATSAPMIGVAQVAISSGDYGWVALAGQSLSGNVLLSCAADTALYATTVAGSLDDAAYSSLQPKISGVVCTAARGTTNGSVAVLLTQPFVNV